jgi:hypothetical protein
MHALCQWSKMHALCDWEGCSHVTCDAQAEVDQLHRFITSHQYYQDMVCCYSRLIIRSFIHSFIRTYVLEDISFCSHQIILVLIVFVCHHITSHHITSFHRHLCKAVVVMLREWRMRASLHRTESTNQIHPWLHSMPTSLCSQRNVLRYVLA